MLKVIKRSVISEEGQGLVEYALIISFVAIVVIASLSAFGLKIISPITNISGQLSK